jgi:uncharacterized protein (TIGR03437 family)
MLGQSPRAKAWASVDGTGKISAATSFNSSGAPNTAARVTKGQYTVTYTGLGVPAVNGAGGVAQVSSASPSARCKSETYATSGADIVHSIHCRDFTGADVDSAFNVLYYRESRTGGTWYDAYVWSDQSSAPSFTANPGWSWNSTGGTNTIVRNAVGSYRVTLAGMANRPNGGTVLVTASGFDNAYCGPSVWNAAGSDVAVDVTCSNPAGTAMDTHFLVSFVTDVAFGVNVAADQSLGAFAWTDQASTASYTPNVSYSLNTAAGAIAATRTAAGAYSINFGGLTASGPTIAVVTAYQSTASCSIGVVAPGNNNGVSVGVACSTPAGSAVDSRYDILYLTNTSAAPPSATSLAAWVSIATNPDSRTLFRGGTTGFSQDPNVNTIYVCRGSYQGSVYPGKYIPPFKNCYIENAGSEVILTSFEVLTNFSGVWAAGSGGSIPTGAFPVSQEQGQNFYSCRSYLQGGIEVGKIRADAKTCNISLNGVGNKLSTYEVMVNPWIPSTGADVPGELAAGAEAAPGGQTLYSCRGVYQNGVHLGRFRQGLGCVIGYANQGVQLPSFEVLTNTFSGVWLASSGSAIPAGAFAAGVEPPSSSFSTQYVCRAAQAGGTYPGKLLGGLGCQIQLGTAAGGTLLQAVIPTYEVLIPTPPVGSGPFKIHTKATQRFWVEGSDLLIGTLTQPDSLAARYTFQRQTDTGYKVLVQADSKELHEDGCCSKLLSTRYQPDDDFTRFYFEQQNDGSYRVRTLADNQYENEAGAPGGDQLISVRTQVSDDYSRFFLEPAAAPPVTQAPAIVSFTADNLKIAAGGTATLSWSVTGADSVSIDNRIGAVAAAGTQQVAPSSTTTYTLTAANSIGSVTKQVTISVTPAASIVSVVNGASFAPGPIAPDSIATLFGTALAPQLVVNSANPPPTTLGGVSVSVVDSKGVSRPAPLFFVSGGQINFAVPAAVASGPAQITINAANSTQTATTTVSAVSPGIFTVGGSKVPSAFYSRYTATLSPIETNVLLYDPNTGSPIAIPHNSGDQVYLLLFGTGIRAHSATGVTATVGGVNTNVLGAVAQGQFLGEDQINIGPLPSSLASGSQTVVLTVDGNPANSITVVLR